MSGLILCRSEYAKRPYYIEGAAVNIYSIEEICYFLYHDIYLVGADFFCEELFSYIEKEIKEPELAGRLRAGMEQKAGLSELVLTILRYVDFYTEEEIGKLGNLMERLDNQNVWERLKARADNYLDNSRYNSAIRTYEDIVFGRQDSSLGNVFYAGVWHNMGVAYAKLFEFGKACECFRQAVGLGAGEDTQKNYWTALRLSHLGAGGDDMEGGGYAELSGEAENEQETDDAAMEEAAADELRYVAGRELETCLDNVTASEKYAALVQLEEYKQEGKVSEYYSGIQSLIEEWQEQYRECIK